MEVHRRLGAGFQDYIYHRALEKEFKLQNVSFESEYEIKIFYKGDQIGLRDRITDNLWFTKSPI